MADRVHARITGVVQMVGFRMFAYAAAREHGLTGWVRNRPDGAVEMVAEGERPAVEALLRAVRQGPRGAQVEAVEVTWSEATGEFADFTVGG